MFLLIEEDEDETEEEEEEEEEEAVGDVGEGIAEESELTERGAISAVYSGPGLSQEIC